MDFFSCEQVTKCANALGSKQLWFLPFHLIACVTHAGPICLKSVFVTMATEIVDPTRLLITYMCLLRLRRLRSQLNLKGLLGHREVTRSVRLGERCRARSGASGVNWPTSESANHAQMSRSSAIAAIEPRSNAFSGTVDHSKKDQRKRDTASCPDHPPHVDKCHMRRPFWTQFQHHKLNAEPWTSNRLPRATTWFERQALRTRVVTSRATPEGFQHV